MIDISRKLDEQLLPIPILPVKHWEDASAISNLDFFLHFEAIQKHGAAHATLAKFDNILQAKWLLLREKQTVLH